MSVQGFEFYFDEPKDLQLQLYNQYKPRFAYDEIYEKKIYEDPEFSCNFEFNFDFEANKFNGNFKLFENEMNLITFEEKAKNEFEYQFDYHNHHQELWEWGEQQKSISVQFGEEDFEPFQHSSKNLNLNPTVLPESESNLIYNKSGSIRKKIGRKPVFTGLQQRKDVVLKSLLRKIHSFYWKDINHETNYIKQKKKRGVQYFEEWLKIYIQNKLL